MAKSRKKSHFSPCYRHFFILPYISIFSECHTHHEAHSVLVGVLVMIVETADVLHVDELEDVVDADRKLVVGLLGVHHMTTLGEEHEDVTPGVLVKERVVLVAQSSPQTTETDILAPLEFLQERYAVEYLAVEVP